jgi:hypothetical protein
MENNIEALREEVKKKTNEVNKAFDKLHEAEEALALAVCPFKIGQVIINNNGRKARVRRITRGYPEFKIYGANIKKDGSDGAEVELPWYQDWKLAE